MDNNFFIKEIKISKEKSCFNFYVGILKKKSYKNNVEMLKLTNISKCFESHEAITLNRYLLNK